MSPGRVSVIVAVVATLTATSASAEDRWLGPD